MNTPPTIGFMLIATGKYDKFIERFIKSTEQYFFPGLEKLFYIFTDKTISTFHVEHLQFPLPTLLRFHRFLQKEEALSKCDYLAYCDVDAYWVKKVEPEEVLSPLTATLHCGYIDSERTDFDQNPQSLAYLPANAAEKYKYYAGGFILATPEEYFRMARWCAERINEDLSKNIIAKWHDESHLNKYLNTIRKPEKELSPSFHFPEEKQLDINFKEKYPPKLMMINKNHKEIRKIEYEKAKITLLWNMKQ